MALCYRKLLTRIGAFKQYSFSSHARHIHTSSLSMKVQLEPPYLDNKEIEVPSYPPLNVQIKGYDFTVIERYAKWVSNCAVNMGLEIGESWATPCQKLKVQTFVSHTIKVKNEYTLQLYERNVQVILPSVAAPEFLEIIQAALPEGVNLNVHEHQPEHSEVRYIPDLELLELRKQLDEMSPSSKKN